MDNYKDMRQVLTLTNPPIEQVTEPSDSIGLAQAVNDEMAELVAKYPDRFVGAVGRSLSDTREEGGSALVDLCGQQSFHAASRGARGTCFNVDFMRFGSKLCFRGR